MLQIFSTKTERKIKSIDEAFACLIQLGIKDFQVVMADTSCHITIGKKEFFGTTPLIAFSYAVRFFENGGKNDYQFLYKADTPLFKEMKDLWDKTFIPQI